MGVICSRLVPDCIVLDPPGESKNEIIHALVTRLASLGQVKDVERLCTDIIAREEMISTCIGFGCAVPHAHSAAVDTTLIAAARLSPARDFAAIDGEAVSLVFLLAGPRSDAGMHMKLLSKLARLLHDESFRTSLRSARDRDAFYRIICDRDV